ncbi:hypothetical protein L1987_32336 [Smallanthus sonchifolius]|uniref:Uncharacterized protein n=1 Tax=Smallanthus sonchifolius TaxID=185202 RepID=A0ACB9I8Z3_9ASTR|nr:hypothetical protein L1987_32336 [Smallanthus sonchifolius]
MWFNFKGGLVIYAFRSYCHTVKACCRFLHSSDKIDFLLRNEILIKIWRWCAEEFRTPIRTKGPFLLAGITTWLNPISLLQE